LSKITDLMRRAAIISGVTGALIIGATATANASEPAAPAPAAVSSTGMSHAAQTEDPPTTMSHADCIHVLQSWGYEVTNTRSALCAAASLPIPGTATRIAVCTIALNATGVLGFVSAAACLAATA
jgi:hypothetical protein